MEKRSGRCGASGRGRCGRSATAGARHRAAGRIAQGGQEGLVGPVAHAAVQLGRQHGFRPPATALGELTTGQDVLGPALARASAVDVGGVDEVDARLEGLIEDRVRVLLAGLRTAQRPRNTPEQADDLVSDVADRASARAEHTEVAGERPPDNRDPEQRGAEVPAATMSAGDHPTTARLYARARAEEMAAAPAARRDARLSAAQGFPLATRTAGTRVTIKARMERRGRPSATRDHQLGR